MAYSITAILHPYQDKSGLHKVLIQVIYHRMKVYEPTIIKVKEDEFSGGIIIKHRQKKYYNDIINEKRHEIEKKLLDAVRKKEFLTKKELEETIKGKISTGKLSEYISDLQTKLKGKLSDGRLRHYKVIEAKVEDFAPEVTFQSISLTWLNNFEAWLRQNKLEGNTVLANMSLLIAIFNKAQKEGLIDEKQYKGYQRPKYNQKMAEYLTEDELDKFFNYLQIIEKPGHKLAGFYYLLSAYTGFRLGNAKKFDYENSVHGHNLALRNIKNNSIVSIPIYPKLRAVLDYIHDKPLTLSEDKVRKYCKEMFLFIGIKKDVSYHSSRHSFAMMLMNKGFTIDEVANLIGDSELIAKVYARISNEYLSKKIMDKLG